MKILNVKEAELKVPHLISGGSQEDPLYFPFPQASTLQENQSIAVKKQFIIMVNSVSSRQVDLDMHPVPSL